ncbi:MAG: BirA family transcriptional regulator [Actinomycetota bacterium]|nr:BirA family transcriptional regulator [Actinomycetota bacterium]
MPQPTASRSDLATALAATRFREVRWFASLDSTNRYLADEAVAGAAPGLVVVADEQTAGRGRLGRTWIAPPGASLLASVLLDGDDVGAVDERHLALIAAALAAVDAVDAHCGFRPRLKWPNDLVVGDRKLAGLLAETTATHSIVVGMGLNVEWDSFPPELESTATACNREGRPVPREELLVTWLRGFDQRLRMLAEGGPATLRSDHLAASATLGRRVRIERARDTFEGEAIALTDLGHLVVRTAGSDDTAGTHSVDHTVSAGDVIHLRPIG